MEIKINKIEPPTVEVYNPDNTLLGIVNEYEFLDIRVQIRKANATGYYFVFEGQKVKIDRQGELQSYPVGLLDTMTNYLYQLWDFNDKKIL